MVRLNTFGNVLSGIGLTMLGVVIFLKYFIESQGITGGAEQYPFYGWLIALVVLGVVLLISLITTFTDLTGYVHPNDKMYANMLTFMSTISTLLVYGLLLDDTIPDNVTVQGYLFDMGTMIVIAYIFLFVFVIWGSKIAAGAEVGQVKEMTSRFMLVSLVLGAIMAGVNFALNFIRTLTNSYAWSAGALVVFALVMVLMIVIFLSRRYEPIGSE
ncbi:MAG: hypothetical protein ACTSV3_08780 [Candidatus Thorarchaeota archaeon]|nr:MAG: hypothetical protein DRO87_13050 [Candidatus Thorarchaeota archaeon]RLI55018.1 MAG: hypothetical protein DRP09_11160 [Candidatus Thorarchaeota archaeon]